MREADARQLACIGFAVPMKSYALVALGIALAAAAPLTYPGPLQTYAGFGPLFAMLGDSSASQAMGALPFGLSRLAAAFGLPPAEALKTPIALGFLLGAAGMFVLGARAHGAAGGLLASALYTLLPYRLMTAYVRGDAGESLFWGLLPLLVALAAVIAGLAPGAANRSRTVHGIATVLATVIFGLLLWKLCVLYVPDTTMAEAHLYQVFSAQWGYGGGANWLSAAPLQLGIAPLGLGIISVVSIPGRKAVLLAIVITFMVLLSIVPFSGWWPWAWLLNAPWSLLGLAGFALALLAARLARSDDGEYSLPMLAALVTFVFLASYPYLMSTGSGYAPTQLPLARYGDSAYLLAAETPPLQAGSTVTVTLLWQDIGPFDGAYKVFVHAIDPQQKVWAQHDAEPLEGLRPTTRWRRGELLRDPYALVIPADAPAGLVIETGLYQVDSGQRLRTADSADRVVITPPTP